MLLVDNLSWSVFVSRKRYSKLKKEETLYNFPPFVVVYSTLQRCSSWLPSSSFISHHLGTVITVVEVIAEAYYAGGTRIIRAKSSEIPIRGSGTGDRLHALRTS